MMRFGQKAALIAIVLLAVLAACPSRAVAQVIIPEARGVVHQSGHTYGRAYDDNLKVRPFESVKPQIRCSLNESFLFTSMAHKMASNSFVEDAGEEGTNLSAGRTDVPPEQAEIRKQCEKAIRSLLKERGLDLTLIPAKTLDLSPPPTTPEVAGVRTDTIQQAFQRVSQQRQRRRWSLVFDLAYKNIPLERSSCISVLVRGDEFLIDWRNLPRPEKLPTGEELRENVPPEKAVEVAKADFRRLIEEGRKDQGANKPAGEPGKDDDSTASRPVKELWFDPDGVGRLVWKFSITGSPRIAADISGAEYQVEARKRPGSANPSILTTSRSSLQLSSQGMTTSLSVAEKIHD
ncbi:MAG: hypothetical protein ACLQGP_06260 [Isosphaeraceae bacterium]